MKNKMSAKNYLEFVRDIKDRIRSSQYEALKAVNKELISLYWDIGKKIVEKQEKLGWGKAIVQNLATDLQREFPGIQGFSARNIWYMRNFYFLYAQNTKLQPLVAEIGWTHNLIIMEKCGDEEERKYYIAGTKKYGWTKVPGFNRDIALSTEVTVASTEKIRSFNSECVFFFKKLNNNNKQIKTLEKIRDSLLPKLMSGEVMVVG
jgi:predicted nuclease of restriction endonuclease-like (RecB) superfamily